MNIIIIGNGFDLAHGLPTKYTDFLNFINAVKEIISRGSATIKTQSRLDKKLCEIINSSKRDEKNKIYKQKELWMNLVNDNFWIDYFLQNDKHGKENWIDFESEISKIIKSLQDDMFKLKKGLYDKTTFYSNHILSKYFYYKESISYKEVKEKLYNDLNKLIKALEIYLYQYVNEINCEKRLPDIEKIIHDTIVEKNKILSFNYTNTFERLYMDRMQVDYIHGKANGDLKIENNNMVLGIDEFLNVEQQSKHVEFIEFKKFYQRIYKETGCKYKTWISDDYLEGKIYNLYIFGHSLDVTDGDVLRELILNEYANTVIFYHDKEQMGKQIANLVKILGEDEVIKRAGGKIKTIKFKKQMDCIKSN